MNNKPEYSIVIPAFNSKKTLFELVTRINAIFESKIHSSHEIIFVDDGSSNLETWSSLKQIAQDYENVQSIRLMRNFGQQSATVCGLQIACGNYLITMDDDLQHLPEEIPLLIAKKDHDIVIAQFKKKHHSLSKRMLSRIKSFFDELILGKPKDIQFSSFRLIGRTTIEGMKPLLSTPYPFLPAIMLFVTKDIVGVHVNHGARSDGETGYTFFKMLKMFSNLTISNSSILLRFIGNIGLSISLISFLMAFYFMYRKLMNDISIIGWTSVIVSILFIGGLILFSIGVIGEYLIRIIRGIDNRPNFIVRDHIK